jgi:probable addiction module antidote protein
MRNGMALETFPYQASDFLDTDEEMIGYFEDALTSNDPDLINIAVGNLIRYRNKTALAQTIGCSRMTVNRAFKPGGNPTLKTFFAIIDALGLELVPRFKNSSPPQTHTTVRSGRPFRD